MLRYLKRLRGGKKVTTREVARQRLSMVIMIDRGVLPPGMLEDLQEDIRKLLARYPVFDLSNLVIEMKEADSRQKVQIVVPIKTETSP